MIACSVGCGGDKDSSSKVTLELQHHQDNFQAPSYISLPFTDLGYFCSDTVLEMPEKEVILKTTPGKPLIKQSRMICLIENLPEEIPQGSQIKVIHHNPQHYSGEEPYISHVFPLTNSRFSAEVNLIRNISKGYKIETTSKKLPEFQVQEFDEDFSGGSRSLQVALEHNAINIPQMEIFELIHWLREPEEQMNRDVSLLDLKNVSLHFGISATGFSFLNEDNQLFQTEDFAILSENTPFISALTVYDSPSFIVVVAINNEFMTVMHPSLGYLKLNIEDLENGRFLHKNKLVAMLFNYHP